VERRCISFLSADDKACFAKLCSCLRCRHAAHLLKTVRLFCIEHTVKKHDLFPGYFFSNHDLQYESPILLLKKLMFKILLLYNSGSLNGIWFYKLSPHWKPILFITWQKHYTVIFWFIWSLFVELSWNKIIIRHFCWISKFRFITRTFQDPLLWSSTAKLFIVCFPKMRILDGPSIFRASQTANRFSYSLCAICL